MTSPFLYRHIGPSPSDQKTMLNAIGFEDLDGLINAAVPDHIRMQAPLDMEDGVSEEHALAELLGKIENNIELKPMIGQGYHGCHVPPVIQRNLFENPGWYTSYTPYQAEISQGRMELLFHFQTLVTELTGLPVANASLLDEGTAIAEAAGVAFRHHREKRNKVLLGNSIHPQNIDVLKTRASTLDLEILEDPNKLNDEFAAVIIQTPDTYGVLAKFEELVAQAQACGALIIAVADPLALVNDVSPASWGADMAVGSMQRFGVPLGNGGPHAAYIAVTEKLTRLLPGRIIGQSIDASGNPAYRLALQTREQHIRREKATSNICTAQALLANMSAAYAIWHGPRGLMEIAERVNDLATRFRSSLQTAGHACMEGPIFDTVTIKTGTDTPNIISKAEDAGYLFRDIENKKVSVAFDETSGEADLAALCELFGATDITKSSGQVYSPRKEQKFLSQEIFHSNRSETQMMRYLRKLMDMDLALDKAMIPLGSCTMKLNAAAEMMPVSWSKIANIHPLAPRSHLKGYDLMIADLDRWLSEITGFAKVSFQPNAGSQGEYAGLLAIRKYHTENGHPERNICLIPSSAHGTNPASAQMAGCKVVVVKCDEAGNVDLNDLMAKAEQHADQLAALMITYPSTHGVFEAGIKNICAIVHQFGGQVYLDGANLNAMMGLARPGDIGADVCHMNLHKTFCIPHGGGGPGIGPIGVAAHLVPHLPGHEHYGSEFPVASAPEGSASILPISWMYIRMLGGDGLKKCSEIAILSANYIAHKLENSYPVLFKGANGRVAHECILDPREFKDAHGVTVDDIAKRLIDYGFHAPTMSWPVAGTLMVEPTESEPLAELDRFVDAMVSIRAEIDQIGNGVWPTDDNPLANAPHTLEVVMQDEWPHPYSRKIAGTPSGDGQVAAKYWPPVSRVDNVHGDRNLVCSCPPLEDYAA